MRTWMICMLLLVSGSSFAQLQLVPLSKATAPALPLQKNAAARTTTAAAANADEVLELPFWDDFSYWGYQPDAKKWTGTTRGGASFGTTLTYGVAVKPPSWGVVTFDGINPYDPFNSNIKSDTLVSAPINLGKLAEEEKNGVYLSFYWQLQGLGNRPEARDSLFLYLLDDQQKWHKVWRKGSAAEIDINLFYQEMISLQQAGQKLGTNFLHPNFRMLFRSENSAGGQFDQWHLDYVYLDKGRTAGSIYYKDVAISSSFSSLFGPYTSMPIEQFLRDPAAYLNQPQHFTAFSFLPPGEEALYRYRIDIRSEKGEPVFSTESALQSTRTGKFIEGQQYFEETPKENLGASHLEALGKRDSLILHTTISLAPDDLFSPTPLFLRNDQIELKNSLHDYYAYDDGTAEAGVSLGNRGQRLAYRYTLAEEDTLTHLLFHFPRSTNGKSPALNLKIWSALAGVNGAEKDELLYTQHITIPSLEAPLDSLFSFALNYPLVLPAGDFYVGYEQLSEGRLTLGFDFNTDSSPNIYHSISLNNWLSFNTKGSIMLRPRFASKIDPASLGGLPDAFFPEVKIYPNPTQDRLWVSSEADMLRLLDTHGRVLLQQANKGSSQQLSLGHLPAGLYLLQLQYKNGIQSKRIILVR